MEKKVLIGAATPEQIAEWRIKCKEGIYQLTVGDHVAYFRNPTRRDVGAAGAAASDDDVLASVERFAELTFIGGSEAVLREDRLFLAVRAELQNKLLKSEVQAVLVNL